MNHDYKVPWHAWLALAVFYVCLVAYIVAVITHARVLIKLYFATFA
jgi:hypothetical protein